MKHAALLILLAAACGAQPYSARKVVVDGDEMVRLEDAGRKIEVAIAPSAGNLAWEFKVNGKNLLWLPYASLADRKTKRDVPGMIFGAPWSNRLDGDAYWVNGKKYTLNPEIGNVRRDGKGLPIHGLLVYSPEWRVVRIEADGRHAEVISRLEFWKWPALMRQFPFAHAIEMTYRLADGALEVITRVENLSAEPMPVALGFHPYFQVHDAPRAEWRLRAPVANAAEVERLSGVREYAELVRDAGGRAEFVLEGAKEKVAVVYGPKYTAALVYGSAATPFLSIQPLAAVSNAFNLAHAGTYHNLQLVAPGGEWQESFWIRPSGF
jgi:aldose 1-epimerase